MEVAVRQHVKGEVHVDGTGLRDRITELWSGSHPMFWL